MRKFQISTMLSYFLLYGIYANSFKNGVDVAFPLFILMIAIFCAVSCFQKGMYLVDITEEIDKEKLSEENLAVMKIVVFGLFMGLLTALSAVAMFFHWIGAYTFFGYQVLMGTIYFNQKYENYLDYLSVKEEQQDK